MLFRLTNALATFQALINNILRAHLDIFIVAYLDNILVYSKNKEDYVKHVRTVLRCLDQYNLQIKLKKCIFYATEVLFLGYIIGINGVQISEEKIKIVKKQPQLTTVKEIQSFLGFLNFNYQFIKDYSKIAIPLTKLTRKDTLFVQSKKAEDAF